MKPPRLKPKRQAIADQMLAILRDGDGLQTTGEIAAQLGTYEYQHQGHCYACGLSHDCKTTTHRYQAEHIRPLLVILERRGLVERVVVATMRHHYWQLKSEVDAA